MFRQREQNVRWSWHKAALRGFKEQQEGHWGGSGVSEAEGAGVGGWIGRETVQTSALS